MRDLSQQDRQEIAELNARYAMAIDLGHADDFASIFTEDGLLLGIDSKRRGGSERYRAEGHQALAMFAASAFEKRRGFGRHWSGNQIVEPDNDRVKGTSYLFFLTIDPDHLTNEIMVSAIQHDVYVHTTAGWRMSQRVVEYDG